MLNEYQVVARETSVKLPIGLCRFFGDVREVASEEDVKTFLEDSKKKYPDANHHCWAYRIGIGSKQCFRYSDDGEPSQTAGAPILSAIDYLQLTNTCVVVSRIYGGVNQGVGGLIRAYHSTAATVLKEAGIKTIIIYEKASIPCRYEQVGLVLRELESISAQIMGLEYLENVTIQAKIRPVDFDKFAVRIFDLSKGTIVAQREKEEH
jgi:uncharacterized YigZ family protein